MSRFVGLMIGIFLIMDWTALYAQNAKDIIKNVKKKYRQE